ncbi:TPA: polysaccharide pyruvyl transferase family protein, partial [Streptococcus pneumoniae]|nr:polysaccharide pyruvyl transferase family protein [Streptococcus pneumoniae]
MKKIMLHGATDYGSSNYGDYLYGEIVYDLLESKGYEVSF